VSGSGESAGDAIELVVGEGLRAGGVEIIGGRENVASILVAV
jgi:hypothetical protein